MKPASRLTVWLSLGLAACARPDASAEATLRAFSDDVRDGDYVSAYNRLSARARASLGYEDFVARIEASPEDARRAAERMRDARGRAEVSARVPLAEGEAIELVYEEGAFRIVGNVLDLYDQSSPRGALRTFVRAVEARRYDVVLRLVPNVDRERLGVERLRVSFEEERREEIARLVALLRQSLDAPIEVSGEHATMSYGEGRRMRFVYEDGVWKIESPD